MEERLRDALARVLGRPGSAISASPIGGGCINEARLLKVGTERFFLKTNARGLPGHFEAEAAGLRALSGATQLLVIPEVVGWSDAPAAPFLVTEYLERGEPAPDFAVRLGEGLAELHESSSPLGFGFERDGYCGATPQPNGWLRSWPDFYAERRLGHQLQLAAAQGLPVETCARLERAIDRLRDWIADTEKSSLIHGDLWSGNVHVTRQGHPALIDPAAHYGHAEAELGMMALFGGFEPAVWESYAAARRPAPGWRNRLDLYSLYHVLNHFVLFGGGYAAQADTILRRFVG